MLQLVLCSLYAECAGGVDLPIKWVDSTREFCPKGQFVYFVSNLVKLHTAYQRTLKGNISINQGRRKKIM